MRKSSVSQPIVVQYHLAKYGEELLMEGVGLDAVTYEAIKASLTADVQTRVFGWRNLATLPHGKGETIFPWGSRGCGMNSELAIRIEDETRDTLNVLEDRIKGLVHWRVPAGCGFPDVPSGSSLFYEPGGEVQDEGLYVIRENGLEGKMYVRILWHEIDKIRLVQTSRGKIYGHEIVVDVKDLAPAYVCCGRVRVQISPVEPVPAGAVVLPQAWAEKEGITITSQLE